MLNYTYTTPQFEYYVFMQNIREYAVTIAFVIKVTILTFKMYTLDFSKNLVGLVRFSYCHQNVLFMKS